MASLKKCDKTIVVGIFIALFFCFVAAVPVHAGTCEAALFKCGVDAAISALFTGFQSGLMYFTGCLIGYEWCLKYY